MSKILLEKIGVIVILFFLDVSKINYNVTSRHVYDFTNLRVDFNINIATIQLNNKSKDR